MIEYVTGILMVPLVALILIALFEPEFVGPFMCKHLHWHKPNGMMGFLGGFQLNSVCKYCGKDILMDSQGNWF